ncbi:hypothetical protein ONZ51_g7203 [Trametes cubensis]|uniref:Uncharacterized protein n=1 Tax=Trametes cubensis TaxID=1111947 RepID=A0AAD7X9D2_9APHY|nr:hypothetical protein ONZ51_g7203 [Trametes cubensis]
MSASTFVEQSSRAPTVLLNAPTSTTSEEEIDGVIISNGGNAVDGGDCDGSTSTFGPSSNGESSLLSSHSNYDLIRRTNGIASPASTAIPQATPSAGKVRKIVVAALAASLGASASLAIVLVWLRWRTRARTSPVMAAMNANQRVCIIATPDGSHLDGVEQDDSDVCGAYGLPASELGEDNHSNEIRRRVRNGQDADVRHSFQSSDQTTTFPCNSDSVDQATSALATRGRSGPGEQRRNTGPTDAIAANSCTQENAETHSVVSYSTAPTYVSQERAPSSVFRNASYGHQWNEGGFMGLPSRSDLGEDEAPPPYEPRNT